MKNRCPARQKDRFAHALTRPLNRIPFEMVELMRADLFELLDILTTTPCTAENHAYTDTEIQIVADRLKQLTCYRSEALERAIKARRVEFVNPDEAHRVTIASCGPRVSPQYWEELGKQWERAHG